MKIKHSGLEYNIHKTEFNSLGNRLVFSIHGRPADSQCLLPILNWCKEMNFNFFGYDQYGSGQTQAIKPISNDCLIEHFAKELAAVLKQLNSKEKITIWAHSVGALFVTTAMVHNKDIFNQVDSLIFSGFCPNRIEFLAYNESRSNEDNFSHKYICRSNPWPDYFSDSMNNTPYGEITLKNNYDDLLQKIILPTLIIYGQYDICSDEQATMLSKNLINSEIVKIQNSSHYPFVENAKETFHVVSEFIKRIL
ncbi:MAG: alpha/beta hydrolase [Bdellovibrionaceae bacterium]|nr:alpha/beta hydrolase [Pseudobdellovibrionaceae bacterium]NUM60364.1 alpha/beta hydrolase [Pseudobdellovibrionaceae bacterium]